MGCLPYPNDAALARLAFTRQSGREASLLRLAQTEIESGLNSFKVCGNLSH
jgi:hypothetical protein